jgi:hypothetical protein
MWENDKELFLQKKAWEKDSNNTQTRKENDFINFEQDIAKNIKDDRLKRAFLRYISESKVEEK